MNPGAIRLAVAAANGIAKLFNNDADPFCDVPLETLIQKARGAKNNNLEYAIAMRYIDCTNGKGIDEGIRWLRRSANSSSVLGGNVTTQSVELLKMLHYTRGDLITSYMWHMVQSKCNCINASKCYTIASRSHTYNYSKMTKADKSESKQQFNEWVKSHPNWGWPIKSTVPIVICFLIFELILWYAYTKQ